MLPLVYQKVPMNMFYGFRTKHTLASNPSWYHLNEIGGMIFTDVRVPIDSFRILGLFLPESMLVVHSTITLSTLLVSILVAVLLFVRYAVKYERSEIKVNLLTNRDTRSLDKKSAFKCWLFCANTWSLIYFRDVSTCF